jgi:hypothetical protein
MSSGRQACYDDECDWENLQKEAKITYARLDSSPYSSDARWAEKGYREYSLVGDLLLAYIKKNKEIEAILVENKKRIQEINTLKELREKYPDE